jgi:hypothetical protein
MSLDPETLNSKVLELLPALRAELGDVALSVSDDDLLRFLRWKPVVSRAADRFRVHLKWKQANPGLFDETLRISDDPELERLLQSEVIVIPPSAKTKVGGPIVIGRLRNNDMKDGRTVKGVCRMLMYTFDRLMEREEMQLHGVTVVHDLKGLDRSRNLHIDIPKTVFGAMIGHFPMRINAIYLWNAPFWFSSFFSVASLLILPKKVRKRVHFIATLEELDSVMDRDLLMTELGGKTEFSSSEWVQEQKERELNGSFVSMTNMVKQ